jgi:ABC-type phosphate/phosphonate transport system substrate-binding protein
VSDATRTLAANARMYSVEARSADAWTTLVAFVADEARVPLAPLALAPGAPLEDLWRRDDLGCALMCGWPWVTWDERSGPRPRALAVPVPDVAAAERRPVYRTSIVVRDDAPFASLGDLSERRFAFTTPSSQSGYQAVRAHMAAQAAASGGRAFGRMVGPLVTPRRVVEAILGGEADAGPLDSYWLAILARNEPATAARLRVLESTMWTPLPLFVCAASVPAAQADALAAALRAAGSAPALADVRATLVLADVAPVVPASYAVLLDRARSADALGYAVLR